VKLDFLMISVKIAVDAATVRVIFDQGVQTLSSFRKPRSFLGIDS